MAGMNMQQLMKQAQKMQQQLAEAQENLEKVTVDASAGGGMVKVTVNGQMQLKSITIDPDALDPEDVEVLQDMIIAAVNEGVRGVSRTCGPRRGRGRFAHAWPIRHAAGGRPRSLRPTPVWGGFRAGDNSPPARRPRFAACETPPSPTCEATPIRRLRGDPSPTRPTCISCIGAAYHERQP